MSVSEFSELRPLLFSIAYRMLSSVSDAEDVVQDAFLRYHDALAGGVEIASAKAYLSAIVTRISIDQLRSARRRRESYVGQWLPEPLLTDDNEPGRMIEQAESLSVAFLLVLERLSPVERAVFLLHDVFAYDYDEIAEIVDKSPVNCRQLAARARRHIESGKPRFDASTTTRDELAGEFFSAVTTGDMEGLVSMLASDVVVIGDGGGKVPQWTRPIVGIDNVSRLLIGIGRQMARFGIRVEPRQINSQPGAIFRDRNGLITNVFMLEVAGGVVHAVRGVINPDKLRHLGQVADVRAVMRAAGAN